MNYNFFFWVGDFVIGGSKMVLVAFFSGERRAFDEQKSLSKSMRKISEGPFFYWGDIFSSSCSPISYASGSL